MKLLEAAKIATMSTEQGYGLLDDGAIVIDGAHIAWVGPRDHIPSKFEAVERISFDGQLITPALIDCHTHLIFGGHRAQEFEMRLEGASYEEIARAGGGINATVQATRLTPKSTLLAESLVRVDNLIAEGACVVEIKSGYGLDTDTELKILQVAREVEKARPIRVRTSFLGAHAVPSDIDPEAYIHEICIPTLKQAHAQHLVNAVDGFCEKIAFSPVQLEPLFQVARDLDLSIKLHAEQLSHSGGIQLATRYNAISVDHVEYADDADIVALAHAGSVPVLLPGAFYTLGEKRRPPIASFRRHKVPMAVATDWNPGTSPLGSLLLAMNMVCTLFGLTPYEALAGTTRNAARALGLNDCGQLATGFRADLCVWDVSSPAELSYRIAQNTLSHRIFGGAV